MFGLLIPMAPASHADALRRDLQTPTSGTIRFKDIDVIKEPEKLRQVLGYLPQDFGVYPRHRLRHARPHGGAQRRTAARERANRRGAAQPGESVGRRKKAIAGFSAAAPALRHRPGADRPASLDRGRATAAWTPRSATASSICFPKSASRSWILSTHIVDDVSDLCPRMAIISDGRIVGSGAPDELTRALEAGVWKEATLAKANSKPIARNTRHSTRLVGGSPSHIVSDADPGNGFAASRRGSKTSISRP